MVSTLGKCAAWSPPALRVNEVQVWSAGLDPEPADFDRFEETLAPDERARAARFYFPEDRRRFEVADAGSAQMAAV